MTTFPDTGRVLLFMKLVQQSQFITTARHQGLKAVTMTMCSNPFPCESRLQAEPFQLFGAQETVSLDLYLIRKLAKSLGTA